MLLTRLSELPWTEQRSPGGRFQSFCRNVSFALGGIRNVGTWGGGHPFDLQLRRIPPGAAVCPFHLHLAQWELFHVLAGTGTVRVGAELHAVRAGHVFLHPPGEAHQLTNTGAEDLEVLIVADNPQLDAFYYPDTDKWGLRPPGHFFHAFDADYFAGEESTAPATAGARTVPPPAPTLTAFATRLRHVDELPLEPWSSPKGRFRGASKELSIALGAKRNTPTGLGGHPFDLELNVWAPGACGCPFHSHAAQWELYAIQSGTAIVRAGDASHPLRAGDVCLHPPGEPHQIRNASATEPLTFLLVADNPPADYWFYPDANKWGVREPRTFFRPTTVDYYDGEE